MVMQDMGTGAWCDYRSPFDDDPDKISKGNAHWDWKHYRDNFAKTGSLYDFNMMLNRVTLYNPPDAPKPVIWMKTKSGNADTWWSRVCNLPDRSLYAYLTSYWLIVVTIIVVFGVLA